MHPKKRGRLRVVYDCSARFQATSLNDRVHQGPDLINKLVGVLIRFRQHPITMMADIQGMFNQTGRRFNQTDSTVDNIHNICHVVKLKERRKYLLQCFMYKRAAADLSLRRSSRSTRADDKLNMQNKRAKSTTYQRSPIYRGIDIWNNLSRDIQLCESIIQFKKCVKPMV